MILCLLSGRTKLQIPDRVAQLMNQSADPCQDFYVYACGNWGSFHTKAVYDNLIHLLDFNYHKLLSDLLENNMKKPTEPRFVGLVRDFYTSCRKNLTTSQASEILKEIIQKPYYSQSDVTIALTAAFRIDVLLDMGKEKMSLVWAEIMLRPSPDWDWTPNDTYRETITRDEFDELWEYFSAGTNDKDGIWWRLQQLERNLLEPYEKAEEVSEDQRHRIEVPPCWLLPWPKLPVYKLAPMITVLTSQSYNFLLPYIYLRILLTQKHRPHSNNRFWQIGRIECAEQTRGILSHPTVWLIEQYHPKLKEDTQLQGIFVELKHRFGQKLRANRNWFSPRTQYFLLAKLEKMMLRLSILPRQDSTAHAVTREINKHYRGLRFNTSDYFGNLMRGWEHQRPRNVSLPDGLEENFQNTHFRKRRGWLKTQINGYGSFSSPFFMPRTNMLIVPLSLLAYPLYEQNQLDVLTYSSLGFILGHELSHGFAPIDVSFGPRGQWTSWAQADFAWNRHFQSQIKCLNNVFGNRLATEKFADAIGLELAYFAYFHVSESDRKRNVSAISTLENRRLFFLNFAQFFCSNERLWDQSAEHGSDRQRVNEAVYLFPPFFEAFNCQLSIKKDLTCKLY
ncbi:hypothetical protein KR018_004413 [Drosophila ironensis]|nr:hypothetical protein KR018_004413 [Drosophila ironensis]